MKKYVVALAVLVILGTWGLIKLRGPHVFSVAQLAGAPLKVPEIGAVAPNASSGTSPEPVPAASSVPEAPYPHFSSDEREKTAPSLHAEPTIDPAKLKLYRQALNELELEACNKNGTFVVQRGNSKNPKSLKSGASIEFYSGLVLVAKVVGYPNCHIVLTDGDAVVGELSVF